MDALLSGRRDEGGREGDGNARGVAAAIVTDNRDPRNLGRVRVRFPWLPQSQASYWARIAVPMAGGGRGVYFLPEVGDEVLVAFEREDLSHPYVIGGLWNARQQPPANNADGRNDRRLIHSRDGHELRFEDGSSSTVELKLQDGKHLLLDNQGVTLEDERGNTITIESGSGTITIESRTQLKLKATSISIEATASAEIKANGTLTLRGALVQIN
ncbi:conserved hypothetical protein [uncultured Defluviicoccus sp.]|uniref:Gp5/Type VI secretion system Vgr protein OB-fold domain-containing protein n=1 Tax=metagenome TaxID=256318 RepID=A0A380TB49_9ZZZZ|nr:conserved hypothetical protein [uncultured Defluviicoccus sp.]